MHIAGIKRLIRVFGMDQIPQDAEYANVKPAKRPSGIYLLLTYYVPKKEGSSRFSVGLSSDRRDGDELNQREEIIFIPVSIGNSLSNLDPVVEAFQLAS